MRQILFEGIGTHWKVLYFAPSVSDVEEWESTLEKKLLKLVNTFDSRYSRFKKDSLVWQIAQSKKTEHHISDEFAQILTFGQELMRYTNGQFNPAIGQVLENMGYDSEYSFVEHKSQKFNLEWSLEGNTLVTPKPVLLDIGGWGKGYLIDLIATELTNIGIQHYLVDGGGDIVATDKPDGSAWIVALEHPTDTSQAFGVVHLAHMAMASSGTTKRRFGQYHHLVNSLTQQSIHDIVGVHVQTKTATQADGAATALFVEEKHSRVDLATKLNIEYVLIDSNLHYNKSDGFIGSLFV